MPKTETARLQTEQDELRDIAEHLSIDESAIKGLIKIVRRIAATESEAARSDLAESIARSAYAMSADFSISLNRFAE